MLQNLGDAIFGDIDSNPFLGCENLREIILPPESTVLQYVDGVLIDWLADDFESYDW